MQYHTERSPLSLRRLQWEKRAKGTYPAPTVGPFLGSPHSGHAPQELQGYLQDLTPGNPIVMEKWGRAGNNHHSDLSRPSPTEQWSQRLQPFRSSAEPRWAQSGQGTRQDAGLPDVGPQTKSCASPGGWSALAQAAELSQSPAYC